MPQIWLVAYLCWRTRNARLEWDPKALLQAYEALLTTSNAEWELVLNGFMAWYEYESDLRQSSIKLEIMAREPHLAHT